MEEKKNEGPEVQHKHCKDCGELKQRISDGRFGTKKDKRWRGVCGRLWNGSRCPECHAELAKALQKARWAKQNEG